MEKQNLNLDVSDQKKPETTPDAEKKAVYTCGFCGKTFESKLGLKKHYPKCEASPDEPEPDEKDEGEGMRIFDDENDEKSESDEGDYECGHCGEKMARPYKHCPECGEELEWP